MSSGTSWNNNHPRANNSSNNKTNPYSSHQLSVSKIRCPIASLKSKVLFSRFYRKYYIVLCYPSLKGIVLSRRKDFPLLDYLAILETPYERTQQPDERDSHETPTP